MCGGCDMLKSFLGDEANTIMMKVAIGLFCASVFLVSLFHLGNVFQQWVMQYRDHIAMSMTLFVSTLVLSLLGMFFLVKPKQKPVKIEVENPGYPFLGLSVNEKAMVFARGFLDGVMNGGSSRRPQPQHYDATYES